jgi:energy-coupling factor transporter ATP-binding protein EcfA2
MFIERIEVPAFRVLRDVVLDFTGGHEPKIFPLASLNGGGKSTLLQLVFALLHCSVSGKPGPLGYLANILDTQEYGGDEQVVARITLSHKGKRLDLEFVSIGFGVISSMIAEPPEDGFRTKDPNALKRIYNALEALETFRIVVHPKSADSVPRLLVCRSPGMTRPAIGAVLKASNRRVFLLGPSSQQYLFLGKAVRRGLLNKRPQDEEESDEQDGAQTAYHDALIAAVGALPGFLAYDWLTIDPLIDAFKQARDQDFQVVVRTGIYGTNYAQLKEAIKTVLVGKDVRPTENFDAIEFIVTDATGKQIVLGPEDLSQGELKRLMIFAWLRTHQMTDAVVLIDELETSLHPDWQFRIVRDLQEWGPNNQYILATHSYELCEMLTPSHVRELEPRLPLRSSTSEKHKE